MADMEQSGKDGGGNNYADDLAELDPLRSDRELARLILSERKLQNKVLNLTAAGNFLTPLVGSAMSSELSNIHCEGYPGKRFHEGQENADGIERLAIERACNVFSADHANVQAYRGTMANLAACLAAAEAGSSILGFACDAGGHYTTGSQVHLTAKLFNIFTYSVNPDDHTLDYNDIRRKAEEVRPAIIFTGDTSWPGEWDWLEMRAIADDVDAVLVADISQSAGLVAAGVLDSPCLWADIVTMATYKTLRGPRAGLILCKEHFKARVDRAVFPVCQDGTSITVIAGIAASLHEAAQPAFHRYAHQVVRNAAAMADAFTKRGYKLISGGTRNHACLIDMSAMGLAGRQCARTLAGVNIICNANQIPYDKGSPVSPSGFRVGTSAVTTLGMQVSDMEQIVEFIDRALSGGSSRNEQNELASEVSAFRKKFDHSNTHHACDSAETTT